MRSSLRCGARTRSGMSCQAPAVRGKRRCRMHGGASGTGAPQGNRNALTHGLSTREMIERRKAVNAMLRRSRHILGEID
ncbi:HGGxSTG domain-containing protein [Microvirga lenta]|uniref:HGGxSTG domain-containing protein n=1 Tax=Microvirga lenta TaxID=2881337 RepID=UPI00299CE549|nr:HGGxSTG domain-containing protein [Microvirga lenta]